MTVSLFVESISEEVNQINQVFVDIEIGNKKIPVSFKLDTEAQVNVIPLHVFHQLEYNNLESTTQKLFGYGGKPLKVEGKCTLACSYKGTQGQHHFYVVSTQAPPILRLSLCLSLNLIQLILFVSDKGVQPDPKKIATIQDHQGTNKSSRPYLEW